MNTILTEIMQHKQQEVAARRAEQPVSELLALCKERPAPLGFLGALRGAEVAVIAELKKQSPTAGIIKEHAEVSAIVRSYQQNGAAAISVLTDSAYFGGSLRDLSAVRNEVDMPLLRKDFILDAYQIAQARAFGADAVLLIAAALDHALLRELLAAAREYGLQPLLEVHTVREADRVLTEAVDLIGINNRNLDTFTVDLNTTAEVVQIVPREVCVVSESGITSRADIEALATHGVDAVLIGETLMRQPHPGEKLIEFTGVEKCSR